MSAENNKDTHFKLFREDGNCAKYIVIASDGTVTVMWHPGMLATDDQISGPGIVVRSPLRGCNTITITCERDLIFKARADFNNNKLNIGDVPKTFVQEVLDICASQLRNQ